MSEINPFPPEDADRHANQQRQHHRDGADLERGLRSIDHSREDVPSELVGAHQVLGTRWGEPSAALA